MEIDKVKTQTTKEDDSLTNMNMFMKNITDLMDKLESIQSKMGPMNYGSKETGIKGSVMKLFEACCPISRNLTDEQLWDEHKKIRSLLNDEQIPKINNINKILGNKNNTESVKALIDWCSEKGAKLENVKISTSSNNSQNVCLVSANSIEPEHVFLSLPKSVLLVANELSKDGPIAQLSSRDPVLYSMENVLMSYCLIIELYKNTSSHYWPYLQTLPTSYNNACYYSEEDMKVLYGTSSFRDAHNAWKNCVRQYAYFQLKIIDQSLSTNDTVKTMMEEIGLAQKFCYEDFRWAAATVLSKGITVASSSSIGTSLLLVPIVDLCKQSETTFSLDYDSTTGECKVKYSQEIKADSELLMFNGTKTNSQFVINDGIFPDNNIYNFIIYHLLFDETSAELTVKRELMKSICLSEYSGFPIGTSYSIWSGDLMAYLRIYVASAEDISILLPLDEEHRRTVLFSTSPLSQNNENRAIKKLDEILKQKKVELDNKAQECKIPDQSCLTPIRQNIHKLIQSELVLVENIILELSKQFKDILNL